MDAAQPTFCSSTAPVDTPTKADQVRQVFLLLQHGSPSEQTDALQSLHTLLTWSITGPVCCIASYADTPYHRLIQSGLNIKLLQCLYALAATSDDPRNSNEQTWFASLKDWCMKMVNSDVVDRMFA